MYYKVICKEINKNKETIKSSITFSDAEDAIKAYEDILMSHKRKLSEKDIDLYLMNHRYSFSCNITKNKVFKCEIKSFVTKKQIKQVKDGIIIPPEIINELKELEWCLFHLRQINTYSYINKDFQYLANLEVKKFLVDLYSTSSYIFSPYCEKVNTEIDVLLNMECLYPVKLIHCEVLDVKPIYIKLDEYIKVLKQETQNIKNKDIKSLYLDVLNKYIKHISNISEKLKLTGAYFYDFYECSSHTAIEGDEFEEFVEALNDFKTIVEYKLLDNKLPDEYRKPNAKFNTCVENFNTLLDEYKRLPFIKEYYEAIFISPRGFHVERMEIKGLLDAINSLCEYFSLFNLPQYQIIKEFMKENKLPDKCSLGVKICQI